MAESFGCPATRSTTCEFAKYCLWSTVEGAPAAGGDLAEKWAPITQEVIDEVADKLASPKVAEEFRRGMAWPDPERGERYCSIQRSNALKRIASMATDAGVRKAAQFLDHGERLSRSMFNIFPEQTNSLVPQTPDAPVS